MGPASVFSFKACSAAARDAAESSANALADGTRAWPSSAPPGAGCAFAFAFRLAAGSLPASEHYAERQ